MEVARTSEKLVYYRNTMPDDLELNLHHREDIKYRTVTIFLFMVKIYYCQSPQNLDRL